MLYGSRMTRFSFGVNVHIFGPSFKVALPASRGGAVKRIKASSRPRVHAISDERRSQSGR